MPSSLLYTKSLGSLSQAATEKAELISEEGVFKTPRQTVRAAPQPIPHPGLSEHKPKNFPVWPVELLSSLLLLRSTVTGLPDTHKREKAVSLTPILSDL